MLIVTGLLYKNVRRIWKSNEYISYKNEKWIKEKYCIPIQKIKAKIEELDIAISECIYLDEDDRKIQKSSWKRQVMLIESKKSFTRTTRREE